MLPLTSELLYRKVYDPQKWAGALEAGTARRFRPNLANCDATESRQ